jgi:uncharacterized integral membrane protein
LLYWLVVILVTAVLVVFTLNNLHPVQVDFWPLPVVDTRVFLIVLAALLVGFLVGDIVAWIGGRHWRREARLRAQRIAALERELAAATRVRQTSGAVGRALSPVDSAD